MNAAEGIVESYLTRSRLTAVQEYLKEVDTIMEHPGSYIDCPDCSGEGGMSWVCESCGGEGCRNCNLGMVFLSCKTCKGKKQVYKVEMASSL